MKPRGEEPLQLKKFLRDNGLSLTVLAFFFLFWSAQAIVGFLEYKEDEQAHHRQPAPFTHYLVSSHFWEATFENWESEFLQMSAYVVLTALLFQRGSAESNDPDEPKRDEKYKINQDSPSPVKAGGWRLRIYEYSLSLSLFAFFLMSWTGHALAGHSHYNTDRAEHGLPEMSLADYVTGSRFWFESSQKWQSEFLAVASIVLLSIWLRQKGSLESKPVGAPYGATGE